MVAKTKQKKVSPRKEAELRAAEAFGVVTSKRNGGTKDELRAYLSKLEAEGRLNALKPKSLVDTLADKLWRRGDTTERTDEIQDDIEGRQLTLDGIFVPDNLKFFDNTDQQYRQVSGRSRNVGHLNGQFTLIERHRDDMIKKAERARKQLEEAKKRAKDDPTVPLDKIKD